MSEGSLIMPNSSKMFSTVSSNLEPNSTGKFETVTQTFNQKLSIYKTDKIKCSNRYETLYTDNNDDQFCNSYDDSTSSGSSTLSNEISDKISSGNIQKKKNRKI